jgi:integrase
MTGKRTNGEGTISRRKNGTFEGAAYVLMVGSGRKRVHVYGKTARDVQEKLTAAKMQSLQGIAVPDRSWTLDEYIDYWLEHVAQASRRLSTYRQYAWVATRFLKPELGAYRLEKLTVATVQKWLDHKFSGGESAHRVRLLRTVLSAILTRAQREELVQRNVARLVELPRYQAKEREPWSAEEAKQFLAASVGHELYPAFLVLMLYGLRRGEVLGLRWCDVDFERDALHIRNQLQRLGGSFRQGPVKTRAGKRELPMLKPIRDALLDLRGVPAVVQRDSSAEGLVFVNALGQPRDPTSFRVSFQRLAKRNGIRVISVHDVRHTAATLLKDLGVPARDAQLILGHSDIATTQQIYQHGSLENRQVALEKIESALLPQRVSQQSIIDQDEIARCRKVVEYDSKNGRSAVLLGIPLTSVIDWYTRRDSNPRPLVPEFEFSSSSERVKGVERALNVWKRQWLVGAVVVSVVVRTQQFLAGELATGSLLAPVGLTSLVMNLGKSGLCGDGIVRLAQDVHFSAASVE